LIERTSPFRIGRDLFLAFCPERIAEGRSFAELPSVPQIVGGVDPASSERAARFFRLVTPTVHVVDSRSAELAKLFCNMYRYIDFAVANEFMMMMFFAGERSGGLMLTIVMGKLGGPVLEFQCAPGAGNSHDYIAWEGLLYFRIATGLGYG
jgi:hypothetical protein